jgi:hypothetical protein
VRDAVKCLGHSLSVWRDLRWSRVAHR